MDKSINNCPFNEEAEANNFTEFTSIISHTYKSKNSHDQFHRVVVTDHFRNVIPFQCQSDVTIVTVENMSIGEIQTSLTQILINLEEKINSKTYLITFACGLSTILRKHRFDSDCRNVKTKRLRCCLQCQLYLPLKLSMNDAENDLNNLCSYIEDKFSKASIILCPILTLSLDDIHNEMLTDHISCCPHLFAWDTSKEIEEYIINQDKMHSIEEVLNLSISNYNAAVEKICNGKCYLFDDFSEYQKSSSSKSLLERQRVYIQKTEELLKLGSFAVKKNDEDNKLEVSNTKFVADKDGTIELGLIDLNIKQPKTTIICQNQCTTDTVNLNSPSSLANDNNNDTKVLQNNSVVDVSSTIDITSSVSMMELGFKKISDKKSGPPVVIIPQTSKQTSITEVIENEVSPDNHCEVIDDCCILNSTSFKEKKSACNTEINAEIIELPSSQKFDVKTPVPNASLNCKVDHDGTIELSLEDLGLENVDNSSQHKPLTVNQKSSTNYTVPLTSDTRRKTIEIIDEEEIKLLQVKPKSSIKKLNKSTLLSNVHSDGVKSSLLKQTSKSRVANTSRHEINSKNDIGKENQNDFILLSTNKSKDKNLDSCNSKKHLRDTQSASVPAVCLNGSQDDRLVESGFVSFNEKTSSDNYMISKVTIRRIGVPMSKRFKRAPFMPVVITDNRMKLLPQTLEEKLNFSMVQVFLKPTKNISFYEQLCCVQRQMRRFFCKRSKKQHRIYFVLLGTNELIKKVHLSSEPGSANIVANVYNNLHVFRHMLYNIDSCCKVVLSPLPYTGLNKTDALIDKLNGLIYDSNINDNNLNEIIFSNKFKFSKSEMNNSNYVMSLDDVAAWAKQCFEIRKEITLHYISTNNLKMKFKDKETSSSPAKPLVEDTLDLNKNGEKIGTVTGSKKRKSSGMSSSFLDSPVASSTPQANKDVKKTGSNKKCKLSTTSTSSIKADIIKKSKLDNSSVSSTPIKADFMKKSRLFSSVVSATPQSDKVDSNKKKKLDSTAALSTPQADKINSNKNEKLDSPVALSTSEADKSNDRLETSALSSNTSQADKGDLNKRKTLDSSASTPQPKMCKLEQTADSVPTSSNVPIKQEPSMVAKTDDSSKSGSTLIIKKEKTEEESNSSQTTVNATVDSRVNIKSESNDVNDSSDTNIKIKVENKDINNAKIKSENKLSTASNEDYSDITAEVPIKTISDAFAQIVSINMATKGRICQSYQGLMAVWKHAWPSSDKPKVDSLISYSLVQIAFISKVIDSCFKLLSKKVLSQSQQNNLTISANIIKKHLDDSV